MTCEWCDKEFAGQKGQRFCSRSHASLFTAQRKMLTECLWCHEGFKARKGQEFCCQAHGALYRKQHKRQPECQWCHQKFTSAWGTRFCSKSHAGLFNAKKRSEDSGQSKREDDQVELDRMDRIAEDVWQRILRQEAAFLAAINGRLRRVLPGELHLANLSACDRAARTGEHHSPTVTVFVPKVSQ